MKQLKGLHKIVAREMCAGIALHDICQVRGLDYKKWQRITNSTLFQVELTRLQQRADDSFLEQLEEQEDNVFLLMKRSAGKVAQQLLDEAENYEENATPSSRIKACTEVLGILGYGKNKREDNVSVNIVISQDKLDALQSPAPKPKEMPDTIRET